ncbi:MAG: hypothetical protein LUH07_04110 [Lachnospiraceae bacterium]|nr:hypothetical protein [Lachnospiraceae bacterium]
MYYGQILLYIPALLYNCGLSLTEAYNVYICLISVGTCLITYYCARKIFSGTNAALTAAALYTLSAVRLTNIFTRAAVGEYTAQMFLPLVFLGFYQIYTAPEKEKITFRRYWPVVIGLTGLVVSHLLSVVMCAMIILVFCVMMMKKTLQKTRLTALIRAALLTILISLAQLVPMLSSMSMDINAFYNTNYIQKSGAYLLQILNPVVNNYQVSSDESGYAFYEMSYSIGFSITLGLILFVVWMIRRKRREAQKEDGSAFAAICFCSTILMIFLSTKAFFYDYLDFLPDKIYSILTVYQFPWRWMSFAALFGVFCTATVVDSKEFDRMFTAVPLTLLLGAILVVNTGQIYSDQMSTSDNTIYQNKYYLDFAAMPEYLPYGTNVDLLYITDLIYDEEFAVAENYIYEDNQWKLSVQNFSEETITIDIPVLNYDHYAAYDTATGESIAIENGENSRIRLCIPANYTGTIAVKYELPFLWRLAIALSLITDAALAGYLIFLKRKRHLRKTGNGTQEESGQSENGRQENM